MKCSPEHPCSGLPFREDVRMRFNPDNLTGAIHFVCTNAPACTRDKWIHPVVVVAPPRVMSHAERVLEGLNAEAHRCSDCGVNMYRTSSQQRRCEACQLLARARRRGGRHHKPRAQAVSG